MITRKRHKKQLQDNLQILNNIVSGADAEYPALRDLLITHSGANKGKPNALYKKLVCLHDYALHYEDDGERKMEDAGRGWEWYASQQTLVDKYGSNKKTWGDAIKKLYFMGLLGIYNPADGREYNTPGQQYSAERAKQGAAIETIKAAMLDYGYSAEYVDKLICHPCTWYRIHHYTHKLLMWAETQAPLVKAGAARDKDSMSDAVGAKMANAITDTGYGMHIQTLIRRRILLAQIRIDIRNNGYTTKDAVVNACYERGKGAESTFGDKGRWLETLMAYLPQLKREYRIKKGRPSKAEKEKWGLMDDSHIIRYEE